MEHDAKQDIDYHPGIICNYQNNILHHNKTNMTVTAYESL